MASLTVPFSVHICTIWSFFHSILLIMCNLKGLPIAWTKMVWDCWVTWDRPLPTARYQKQQKLTWQPFSPWSKATWQLFSPTGHFYLSLTKLTVSLSQKKSAGNKDYHWRQKKTYTGGVPHVSHYLLIWICCIEICQVIYRTLFFVTRYLQGGWGYDKVSTAKVRIWQGQKMFGLGVSDFFISSTSKSWWVTSAPYHWTNCLAPSTELILWR